MTTKEKTFNVLEEAIRKNLIRTNNAFRYLPPKINSIIEKYGHGKCHYFAMVCSSELRKGVVAIRKVVNGEMEKEYSHVAAIVSRDPYLFFDVYGYVTIDSFSARYGDIKVQTFNNELAIPKTDVKDIVESIKTMGDYFKLYDVEYLSLSQELIEKFKLPQG